VAVGAAYISVLTGLNTVVQLRAPVAARGRILSIYMMALGLVYPVGAVVQGHLANIHGIRAVTITAAALLLVVLALTTLFLPTVFSNLSDPDPDPDPGPGPGPVADGVASGPADVPDTPRIAPSVRDR
jgi:MFS family permease